MDLLRIRTARLELVLGTPELFRLDLKDRAALGTELGARVPCSWPPPLMDDATLLQFIELASDPSGSGLAGFYWILIEGEKRVLVGNGGLISGDHGELVLGYSVLDEFQGRGIATEAVAALITFGFEDPGIDEILAYTYPSFVASQCVLTKSGFVPAGAGNEPGTIAYVHRR